jgi:hypothetical protein
VKVGKPVKDGEPCLLGKPGLRLASKDGRYGKAVKYGKYCKAGMAGKKSRPYHKS